MKKSIIYVGLLAALLSTGCNKMLDEDPKSVLTPDFLKTAVGFQRGLDAAYAGTRMLWGNQDLFTMTVIGTDEFKRGVDGNSDINNYSSGFNSGNGQGAAVWRNCYYFINACNGLLDFAPAVTELDENTKKKILAEAKFLRAQYYFTLVQFWADVTLNEHFNDQPLTSARRDPQSKVYELIIKDLQEAIPVLPASPKSNGVLPGKASAAAAKHLLAKVYLTRGSSAVAQPTDYENAYLTAKEVIDNRGSLSLDLLPDFKDIHAEGNEGSPEVIWTVQHTSNIPFNGPNNSGGADNVLNHMWVPQYEKKPGMVRSMDYGRPYIRCTPTLWLVDTAFKEKVNDTRYSKTFQTVWFANDPNPGNYPVWPNPLPAGAPATAVAGQPKFKLGDTAIYMPGVAKTVAQINAAPYLMIPLKSPATGYVGYDNTLGPTMKKYFDTRRADLNHPSVRPVIVYRLAETYLMAAEAAFRTSRPTEAVNYINAIRERAAFPTGNAVSMRITAADLNIDFILDERTRELCGENVRWWDLVRTGKLLERVRMHNVDAQRNILPKHVLRPIPQAQIDATTTGEQYNFSLFFPGWN
jgi:starch-binding outer membrane protein, SusD/RagB family